MGRGETGACERIAGGGPIGAGRSVYDGAGSGSCWPGKLRLARSAEQSRKSNCAEFSYGAAHAARSSDVVRVTGILMLFVGIIVLVAALWLSAGYFPWFGGRLLPTAAEAVG